MTPETAGSVRDKARSAGLRVWAEIDLDVIAANVRALRELAGTARLLAVVKGNGYGHGAVPVAKQALDAGAWGVGVIDAFEGEALRLAGVAAPIVVLGASPPALAGRIIANDLQPTIASPAMADALARAAREAGKTARVHLKVETGLNRFGLPPSQIVELANSIRGSQDITAEGVSTHLASVDEDDQEFTLRQYEAFRVCADQLSWVPLHHVASTGAALAFPDLRLDMVRCGIGLYGYYPSPAMRSIVSLSPALALRTRVARIWELAVGESVGYGRAWVAERKSVIALAMAGYADGISRILSNRGLALVAGSEAPVAGRIAMDMHMLDITGIAAAEIDGEVTLIGRQGECSIDADEVAARAATISYEILAGITARVPRLYHKGGEIFAIHDAGGLRETTEID